MIYYIRSNNDILGYNLFAYCSNNFVNYLDKEGDFALALTGVAATTLLGAALAYLVVEIATPAISRAATKVVADITDTVSKAQTDIKLRNAKASDKNYYVYTLNDPKSNEVIYVGRTNDYKRRKAEHEHSYRKELIMVQIEGPMNYMEARGTEQKFIIQYKTLRKTELSNKINGIRWDHKNYDDFMKAADSYWSMHDSPTYVGK